MALAPCKYLSPFNPEKKYTSFAGVYVYPVEVSSLWYKQCAAVITERFPIKVPVPLMVRFLSGNDARINP